MATITIPKKITGGEELVVLTRREYEKAFDVAPRDAEGDRVNLKKRLRLGAIARASRDVAVVKEWFPLDEGAWRKDNARSR